MGTNIELLIKLEADLHHLAVRDIIKNISHTPPIQTSNDTTSHSNVSDVEPTYPAALVAELAQFKELFSKLRFSYLEQVTKERFLRSITADPPRVIETEENNELEKNIQEQKSALQKKKKELEDILVELNEKSKQLGPAYEEFTSGVTKLRTLPLQTKEMQEMISEFYRSASDGRPEMNLPLLDTLNCIDSIESESKALEHELHNAESLMVGKNHRLENLNRDISINQRNKEGMEDIANEAVRRREGVRAAGKADRENIGQWYKSSHEILSKMLDS